jgi:hypothetical protein
MAELKAAAWSAMQAEYCATVTLQLAGIGSHLAAAELDCRQVFSWPEQFLRRTASDVGLLDTLYASPAHLHRSSLLMAFPK